MNLKRLLAAVFPPTLMQASAVLMLTPPSGALSGIPGSTIGWGFSLANPSNFAVVTSSNFCLDSSGVTSACVAPTLGTYTDFIATNFTIVGPPPESPFVTQVFSQSPASGLGSLAINASAPSGATDAGQIVVTYDLYSVDPLSANFDPSADLLSTGNFVVSSASVSANSTPEPSSLALLALGCLLLARRVSVKTLIYRCSALHVLLPVLALTPPAQGNLITNGSFETVTPALPVNGTCTSDTAVYPYGACSATGWTGNYQIGNGATIGVFGASFGIPQPDPDGKNALILQSSGSLVFTSASQSVDIPTDGAYALTFDIAKRTNINIGPQTITVSLDGIAITGGTYSGLPGVWTLKNLTFNVTAGVHALTFSGLDPSSGDVSAFIDNVSLDAAAPEPATLWLMGVAILAVVSCFLRKLA